MLDKALLELADRIMDVQFEERRDQLKQDIQKIQDEFISAGAGRSSRLILYVRDLCGREVVIRAQIVWQGILKVLSTAGMAFSSGIENDLKEEVERRRELIVSWPLECLNKEANKIGAISPGLNEAWDLAKRKVFSQIDLFMLSQRKRLEEKEDQREPTQPTFNIHGSVGAIQTGPGAGATVIQNFASEDLQALRHALTRLKKDLSTVEKLVGYEKGEVIELIEESEAEANKTKPNSVRLTSILSGIAGTIQTVASLQPAYQVLKAALLPLGIFLP